MKSGVFPSALPRKKKRKPNPAAFKKGSAPEGNRFKPGPDQRRGRGPKKGAPNAGRPKLAWTELMERYGSHPKALKRVRRLLRSHKTDPELFHRLWTWVNEQAHGKAKQKTELSGKLTYEQLLAEVNDEQS